MFLSEALTIDNCTADWEPSEQVEGVYVNKTALISPLILSSRYEDRAH